MIDFRPSEEQELIIDTVRQFAENEIRSEARASDEDSKLPGAVLEQAHELGLTANSLPEEFGGGGERSAVTGVLIGEELAWGDLSIALAIQSPTLTALPVTDFGTEAQKKATLPRFTETSFAPGSLALVEPRYDSDPFRPQTTAKKDGDAFVLNGSKCLVPWVDGTKEVVVVANLDGSPQAFLVPADAENLSTTREQNMGIRGLPTVELELKDVKVPVDSALGGADATRDLVNRGRVGLAAMAVGVARASFETALTYAKEREAFGAPIATKQAIAFMLADMAIEIDGARLLVWEAAWRLDQGLECTREALLAKHQSQRMALDVTDGAVQVLGGHGYIRDHFPEMHLRNARGFAAFEALTLV